MADGYERIEGVEVGQYVAYRFFRVDPAWRRLPIEERAAGKEAFADVVDEFAGRIEGLRAYSTVGVRPEADFFLWTITQRYDDLLELGAALNGTPLAAWLETPYSYLGTTKPSVYTDKKRVRQGRVGRLAGDDRRRVLERQPGGAADARPPGPRMQTRLTTQALAGPASGT